MNSAKVTRSFLVSKNLFKVSSKDVRIKLSTLLSTSLLRTLSKILPKETGSVREISELARRIQIHRDCIEFKDEINNIKQGKEYFLVDMVKSLKKVTDEWRGWKHQIFGGVRSKPYVAAIEQVKELLNWTMETFKQTNTKSKKSSESYRKFTTKTLQTFIKTCNQLANLQRDFQQKILKPLNQFFNDTAARKYINKLEWIQFQWKELLAPGAIKGYHFSTGSVLSLKEAESYESFHCFYLVLRLIPDLCFKANLCIELVKNCLDTDNSKAYKREKNFLLSVWMPKQKQKERQVLRESKAQNQTEHFKNIKIKIGKITDDEMACRELKKNLELSLEKLMQGERDTEMRLESCREKSNECKREIALLLKEQDNHATKMLHMDKKMKQRVREYQNVDTDGYMERRNKFISELKQQEDHKRAFKSITLNYTTYQMQYESIENEKVELKFVIKKIDKKINEAEIKIDEVEKMLTLHTNNKRLLELEMKFSNENQKMTNNI